MKPVSVEVVEQTLPFMASPVAAAVRIQLLTGGRADEVLSFRSCDIQTEGSDGVWIVRPEPALVCGHVDQQSSGDVAWPRHVRHEATLPAVCNGYILRPI